MSEFPYRLTDPTQIAAAIASAQAEGIADLEGFYALYRYVADAKLRKQAAAVLKQKAPQLDAVAKGRSPFANAKGKKVGAALKKHEGSGLDVVRLAFECFWWSQAELGRENELTPGNGAIYLFDQGPEVRRQALAALIEGASLRVIDQDLVKLPPEVVEHTELVELNVNSNRLTKTRVPKELSKLTNLRVLCWRHNGLKGVPKPILQMADLVLLQLGGNDFGEGEGLPAKWPFPNLKELDLGHSNLKVFPSGVTTLPALEVLDLSYNYFTELPKDLAPFPASLRELHLPQQARPGAVKEQLASLIPSGCEVKIGGHGVTIQADCDPADKAPTAAVRWGLLCRMCLARPPDQDGSCAACLVEQDARMEREQW